MGRVSGSQIGSPGGDTRRVRRMPPEPDDGRAWLDDAYERHGSEIYGLCHRITGDPGVAEDVTRDVFVRAWRARQQLDAGRSPLRTWLLQTAGNAATEACGGESLRGTEAADAAAAAEAADVLLEKIHAATGPAPARDKERLSPSWLGRWIPAVATAVLAAVVAVVALVSGDDDPSTGGLVGFDVAEQDGRRVDASFELSDSGEGLVVTLRTDGLADVAYDVWVALSSAPGPSRIGGFAGDLEQPRGFEVDADLDDIERLWVSDPDEVVVLEQDFAASSASRD